MGRWQCRWGVGVGALVVTVAGLVLAPSPGATLDQPDPSFHGTWSDNMSIITTSGQGRAASQARLDDVADAGLGMVRQYVWWDRIETSPGVYDWAVLDQLVRDATDRGVTVLPTLLYPPPFRTPSKPAGETNTYPPDDPSDMGTFADQLVRRYGPLGTFWQCTRTPPVIGELRCPEPYAPIRMWEVWNEPDYPSWWREPDPDPAEYLPLLRATHDAIKQVDPGAQVVMGSLTNAGSAFDGGYLDQLYALGAKDYFDVLAVNPYAHDVGAMIAFLKGARGIAASHGDGEVPVLVTEYGWATGGSSPYIVVDEGCQAALLHAATRALADRRDELGIIGAIQFQWHDVPTDLAGWPHRAGVRRADGSAKPGRAALAAAASGAEAPEGASLEACPADRRSLDGELHQVDLQLSGSGTGSVRSSPSWISCGTRCSSQVQPGPLTLTARPDEASAVVAWHGAPGCEGTTCVIDVRTDREITVELSTAARAGTYQEDHPRIAYEGTWRPRSSTRDQAGGSLRAGQRPATATLRYWGRGVRWISRRSPDAGRGGVFVDGAKVTVVDRFARPSQYRRRVFDTGASAPAEHTIRIVHTGTKNRRATDDSLLLDAFVVY